MVVALHGCKPGGVVTLKVRRDGKSVELEVTLGKRGG